MSSSNTASETRLISVEELVSRLKESSKEESSIYCEELIRRFEPLFRATWRRVVAPFAHQISAVTDYQDFVQDVFMRMFGSLYLLHDAKAFPGYLRHISLSVAVDYVRKYHTKNMVPIEDTTEIITAIDEHLLTGILIRSYLERLSVREQEVLILEFFQEYSPAEIADSLGLSSGAVRMTKSRALRKLRLMIVRDAKALEHSSKK